MRGKGRANWNPSKKLGLPLLVLIVLLFSSSFLAGLFASSIFSQDHLAGSRSRSRLLKSVNIEESQYGLLTSGQSGHQSLTTIPFQILSWRPRALYFPKFASPEQCEAIINKAKSYLTPSTLALRKGETEGSTKGVRTSSGTFITASEDNTGVLDFVEEKIARVTMIPRNHGEAFNILHYEIGQKYDCHYDAFNPAEYGPQKDHRVASFLLYLSDVEKGGETMFPFEDDKIDADYDFKKCTGLKVKPKKGDGLLFYSLFVNGTIDPVSNTDGASKDYTLTHASLHGSCPVIKGEKWVATKWIRNQELYD